MHPASCYAEGFVQWQLWAQPPNLILASISGYMVLANSSHNAEMQKLR